MQYPMTDREQSAYADSISRLTIAMREMLGMGPASDNENDLYPATASFRAVIDHIVVANRQPTAWEVGCLYAALCELVLGREENARRRICLALLSGAQQELPFSIIPMPTAEELLQTLEHIKPQINRPQSPTLSREM
jgi:hypothetical protein